MHMCLFRDSHANISLLYIIIIIIELVLTRSRKLPSHNTACLMFISYIHKKHQMALVSN